MLDARDLKRALHKVHVRGQSLEPFPLIIEATMFRHERFVSSSRTLFAAFFVCGLCVLPVQARAEVIVKVAPPALKVEVKTAAPGAGFIWAPGFWERANQQWVWVPGGWVKTHPQHRHYVSARWVKTPRGYVFREGGYATRAGGKVMVVNRHPRKAAHRAKARAHERRSNTLERQSDRLDAKANRLDQRANRLDAQGRHRKADKVERQADRLESRADRKDRKAKRQNRKAKRHRKKARRR